MGWHSEYSYLSVTVCGLHSCSLKHPTVCLYIWLVSQWQCLPNPNLHCTSLTYFYVFCNLSLWAFRLNRKERKVNTMWRWNNSMSASCQCVPVITLPCAHVGTVPKVPTPELNGCASQWQTHKPNTQTDKSFPSVTEPQTQHTNGQILSISLTQKWLRRPYELMAQITKW